MNILSKILDELGLSYTDIAIPSNNRYPDREPILYVDLIDYFITYGNTENSKEVLGISKSALETHISRYLKDILPPKAPSAKWDLTLLALIGMGKCSKCKNILPLCDVKSGKNNTCRDCVNLAARIYRDTNPEKVQIASKVYRDNNPNKVKESYDKWASKNKGYLRQKYLKRRLSIINASYKFNYGDQEELDIIEFYNNCPEGYHVDHIVPLQHPLVCGLHVLANLQYLSAKDNLSKSNKFEIG